MTKKERNRQLKSRLFGVAWVALTIASWTPVVTRTYAESKETYISDEYVGYCEQLGEKMNVAPEILVALIETESAGNPNVISNCGAVGLTQVLPQYSNYTKYELFEPYTNIKAGTEILLSHCEKYHDMGLALVAYNCGEYSKTFKKAKETGELTSYAEKIINRAYELENLHGKHTY